MIGIDPATLRRALNGFDDPGSSVRQGKKFRPLYGQKTGLAAAGVGFSVARKHCSLSLPDGGAARTP
jgi:hypothetical protein